MIVIGVDVHKHSFSAVAVHEVGRQIDCLETRDVPPRLTAPERRRGRVRGKSDLIDALAIAMARCASRLLTRPGRRRDGCAG